MKEKMLLVIDIGNTHTVIGVFDGERLKRDWRINSDKKKTADEYGVLIQSIFNSSGLGLNEFHAVIIASVVPPLLQTFQAFCEKYLGLTPVVVGPDIKTGMPILIDNPSEVGADRIVNGVAAFHQVRQACIVVDFGTATTFDCISSAGEYIGGVIMPGIGISMEALFQMTSKLPRVEITRPKTVIGKNTEDCMQAGIFFGYVSMVEGMVKRITKEMGGKVYVMATGGIAEQIGRESKSIKKVDKMLTLKGLQLLYQLNQ